MVGLDGSRTASSLDAMIADDHIGNIFFIGGWRDSGNVLDASDHVQQQATSASTKKVGFLIAADQEGGQVQQLKGTGFPPLPSALDQGAMPSAQRLDLTRSIGRQLKTAGVNMNLAPVADTVPPGNPRSNEPIGRWSRQYGNDPATAAAGVTDAVKGMESGGVLTTLKHFPGLGRVTGNTDFTTSGIVDNQTTADDQYLQPFRAGIAAGAGAVMVSSAYYAKIDPAHQAIFSAKVMNVLRQDLGFTGVVISDDLNAVAIRSVATGERAVQMIRAGGDIALTGLAAAGPLMAEAITLEADADPTFRAQVDASVTRVLTLKTRAGLTPCSSAG